VQASPACSRRGATHRESERRGATMILDKPFEFDELRAAVSELMAIE
jgi:hypothetical protein